MVTFFSYYSYYLIRNFKEVLDIVQVLSVVVTVVVSLSCLQNSGVSFDTSIGIQPIVNKLIENLICSMNWNEPLGTCEIPCPRITSIPSPLKIITNNLPLPFLIPQALPLKEVNNSSFIVNQVTQFLSAVKKTSGFFKTILQAILPM